MCPRSCWQGRAEKGFLSETNRGHCRNFGITRHTRAIKKKGTARSCLSLRAKISKNINRIPHDIYSNNRDARILSHNERQSYLDAYIIIIILWIRNLKLRNTSKTTVATRVTEIAMTPISGLRPFLRDLYFNLTRKEIYIIHYWFIYALNVYAIKFKSISRKLQSPT